jgi:hypothetical protein
LIRCSKFYICELKVPVWDALKKSGLDYTLIVNGIFLEYLFFTPFVGIDIKNATATIAGNLLHSFCILVEFVFHSFKVDFHSFFIY